MDRPWQQDEEEEGKEEEVMVVAAATALESLQLLAESQETAFMALQPETTPTVETFSSSQTPLPP
jgi:hypothetical protein